MLGSENQGSPSVVLETILRRPKKNRKENTCGYLRSSSAIKIKFNKGWCENGGKHKLKEPLCISTYSRTLFVIQSIKSF